MTAVPPPADLGQATPSSQGYIQQLLTLILTELRIQTFIQMQANGISDADIASLRADPYFIP